MNVFVPENATVRVFQTPNGRMVAASNIFPNLKVEVVTVTNLYEESRKGSSGLPFEHAVNDD